MRDFRFAADVPSQWEAGSAAVSFEELFREFVVTMETFQVRPLRGT
jgi:hypothetical protein